MTDNKKQPRDFQGVDVGDSLFDMYDKSRTYVRITENDRQAWLYLCPKEGGVPYTKNELIELLRENDVVAGLNEDNLIAMAKKKVYEREIKVAEYIAPKEGTDGYYEYFFDVNRDRKKPLIREDGSVDYQSMNTVNSVQEGDVLAKYHPAVDGVPGIDVRGVEIPIRPVKNLPALKGKGIVTAPGDENVYLAAQEGKVEYRGGKIFVNNVHRITGDVDQLIGKIEFYGDVLIAGNVEAGTTVRVGKSLTIEGTVEAADLTAGGDIILKRGIQGNQKAKIVCAGDVYADFIEHTTVQARGNVEANIILNSHIEADGKVVLTGKKGTLIGGNVHGTKGIDCKELGNEAEVKTVVHAGCLPEVMTKQRRFLKEEEELKLEMEEVLAGLMDVEGKIKASGNKTPLLAMQLASLKERKTNLEERTAECRENLEAVNAYMDKARGATVKVEGNLYKGSIICIDQCKMPVTDNTMYMEYRNISGMIAGNVLI